MRAPNWRSWRWRDCRRGWRRNRFARGRFAPIDAVDFDYAAELGCTIRQISRADLKGRHSVRGCRAVPGSDGLAVRARAEKPQSGSYFGAVRRRHGVSGRGSGRRSDGGGRGFGRDVRGARLVAGGASRDVGQSAPEISTSNSYTRDQQRFRDAVVFAILCARSAGDCGAAGADSGCASLEHRFSAAEAGLRQGFAALCDHAGALPRFAAASGAGRDGGAGFRDPAMPVPADPAISDFCRENQRRSSWDICATTSRRLPRINSRKDS